MDWLGHSMINYAFHTCSRKHLLQFQYGFYFQCSTSHGPVGSLMIYTLYRAGPHKERTEPLRAVATRFFKLRSLTIINLLLIPYIRLSITQHLSKTNAIVTLILRESITGFILICLCLGCIVDRRVVIKNQMIYFLLRRCFLVSSKSLFNLYYVVHIPLCTNIYIPKCSDNLVRWLVQTKIPMLEDE